MLVTDRSNPKDLDRSRALWLSSKPNINLFGPFNGNCHNGSKIRRPFSSAGHLLSRLRGAGGVIAATTMRYHQDGVIETTLG